MRLLTSNASQMMTNALTLVTPTFDPVGICVDPLVCSANHACDPNAVVVFDGPRLSFRSLKPIRKDEEIFISYVDSSDPFVRRQQSLQARYHFICRCSKCKTGPNFPEDQHGDVNQALPDSLPLEVTERHAWQLLEEAKKMDIAVEALEKLFLAKDTLETVGRWSLVRQPSPSIRQQIFVKQLSNEQSQVDALCSGFLIYFEIDPYLFSESFHPVRVVHNFTLAMLVLYLSEEQGDERILKIQEKGLDFGVVLYGLLQEVLSNVPKSHGSNSHFAQLVQCKCEEVFTDMTRGTSIKLDDIRYRLQEQWTLLRHLFTADSLSTERHFPIK
ncbi:MAG: hypothetical protein M1822_000158 [Bathelium mastoideum]|nr:MAG: hypothetical protein M1822_000158 [Bathelium mastoideum]